MLRDLYQKRSSFEPEAPCNCCFSTALPTGLWRIGRSVLSKKIEEFFYLVCVVITTLWILESLHLDGLGICREREDLLVFESHWVACVAKNWFSCPLEIQRDSHTKIIQKGFSFFLFNFYST